MAHCFRRSSVIKFILIIQNLKWHTKLQLSILFLFQVFEFSFEIFSEFLNFYYVINAVIIFKIVVPYLVFCASIQNEAVEVFS